MNKELVKSNKKNEKNDEDEFSLEEYYNKEKFDSVEDALLLFQNDELFFKPGMYFYKHCLDRFLLAKNCNIYFSFFIFYLAIW